MKLNCCKESQSNAIPNAVVTNTLICVTSGSGAV